jgi:flagellar hook-associated protein 2
MSSSSSSVSATAASGGQLRITGLSSGIDVDSIVKQLMSVEKTKLNKLKQQEQLATWRQEAYRSIITAVNDFADKYFNLTSSSSILTQGNFKKYTTASSDDAITVSASSSAVTGTHSLSVSQLATAGVQTGSGRLSKDIQGTEEADFTAAQGKSFIITIDGTKRTVTLDSTVTDVDSLQDAIDNAVGEGKVVVGTDSETSALVFTAADDSGVSTITLSSGASDGLDALGFGGGSIYSNRIDT